ncbi:hypothetical protein MUK42_34616 [Musa troglodytarum]|uniref:Uncharacterized protein n=1 Tax=Musa troglodytarum TaxID=320322 RepID=A0A9E7GBJ2_9LILI|nr:hypothetical protein MUK42_34616 [Musa troglodytarum]
MLITCFSRDHDVASAGRQKQRWPFKSSGRVGVRFPLLPRFFVRSRTHQREKGGRERKRKSRRRTQVIVHGIEADHQGAEGSAEGSPDLLQRRSLQSPIGSLR